MPRGLCGCQGNRLVRFEEISNVLTGYFSSREYLVHTPVF
jgi:hypothetical protein